MVRNPDGTLTGDITHYVYWTRLVTLGGIQAAYSGTWPETYAVYPPVTLYAVSGGRHRLSLAAGSRASIPTAPSRACGCAKASSSSRSAFTC